MHALNLAAVYHLPWLEYRYTLPDGRICLRVRTARSDWARVQVVYACNYAASASWVTADMAVAYRDEVHDIYEVLFSPSDPRVRYYFLLERDGLNVVLDQDGVHIFDAAGAQDLSCFHFAHAYPAQKKPDWARGCVGYQIFPDRFRRAGKHTRGLQKWGSKKVGNEYRFGGNLKGILESVPYLKDLGVGIVYMTPLFLSNTSHRYNTFDYYTLDPLLGTTQELRALCDALHDAGIRLLLDGVFNHCGLEFAPFKDAQERGEESPYYDWFFFSPQHACGYMTFAFEPYMPKLNLKNPQAQQYFLNVGRYWIRECHIDGWRLDISPEVYPDFWRLFRNAVKEENPDALLVAECWDDSREWLNIGDMFDSTMHYVLSRAMWRFFADRSCTLVQFDACVNRTLALYPRPVEEVMWNFLSSHDTPRMLTRAGGDVQAFRSAVFFQMTHPGIPIIYYGDELGMDGGADPQCRKSMPWDQVNGNEMLAYYKRLTHMRLESDDLRRGMLRTWEVGNDGLYAYERISDTQAVLCLLHTGTAPVDRFISLPDAFKGHVTLRDLFSGRMVPLVCGMARIALSPGEGMVLSIP